jgi:hypothetical protein
MDSAYQVLFNFRENQFLRISTARANPVGSDFGWTDQPTPVFVHNYIVYYILSDKEDVFFTDNGIFCRVSF